MTVDELFDVKNSFYLGNYQQCITDVQTKKVPESLKAEANIYLYRSYIAQKKFSVVMSETKNASSPELKAVRLFADYTSAKANRSNAKNDLDDLVASSKSVFMPPERWPLLVLGATIYLQEEDVKSALQLLNQLEHIECFAMKIHIYLSLSRIDLAINELKKMQDVDEDCSLTQLTHAWVRLSAGSDKVQDAFYTFQELADKYGPTPLLLNGMAAAQMSQGKFDLAESSLQEALEKDPNNPDTLANFIVVSQHLNKPQEVIMRYIAQLTESHTDHSFVKKFNKSETDFQLMEQKFAPAVIE